MHNWLKSTVREDVIFSPHLLAIVGPTGVGKSALALQLALIFGGEIVNADSRQVYRNMDIGTAKPTREEQALAPHHLIDIVSPDADFNLAQYQKLAYQAIGDIQQRHKLPLLVGGSGLYVWSVVEGWQIPHIPPDLEFRRRLERQASETGKAALYQELLRVDPAAAQRIDGRNVRRVIRALEVYRASQGTLAPRKQAPPFKLLIIGLTMERTELYRRVDLRVEEMIEKGLVAEVEKLVNMGYDFNLPALSGIGYKQIGLFLKGGMTLEDARQQIKTETHRFVRHQYSWFRLKDGRISWFDKSDRLSSEVITLVAKFLARE